MKDRCEDVIPLRRTSRQAVGRPKEAEPPRIPRVARLMALAIKFQDMVDRGEVRDYADLARLGYVTRARVTQIMNLLLLAPQIQEALLDYQHHEHIQPHEQGVRAVVKAVAWTDQVRIWSRFPHST